MIQANLDLLCAVTLGLHWAIIIAVLTLVGGGIAGIFINKKMLEKKFAHAKKSASKIVEDALNDAKSQKKEIILEAKDEAFKLKTDVDLEVKERRLEVQKSEERILQRETLLNNKEMQIDKRTETIEQTKAQLDQRSSDLDKKFDELEKSKENITKELEKVAKLSKEDAKKTLIDSIAEEARKDAANIVRSIEDQAKEEGNKKAINIVTQAIQRCATDHTAEVTVTAVSLPNDEMKGRLIGREGRNIRALENATGIDLIIDDTPDTVIVSGFDPVRREVARISIEKLIQDGRIHPARIEEMVEKVKRDVEATIKEIGRAHV